MDFDGVGGKRTAGVRNPASQKQRDRSLKTIRDTWKVSEWETIFPPEIRPTKSMGDSAVANIASIALRKTPQETKELFLAECKLNGKAVPMSWAHTDNIRRKIKKAGDNGIQKRRRKPEIGSDTEVDDTSSNEALLNRKKMVVTSPLIENSGLSGSSILVQAPTNGRVSSASLAGTRNISSEPFTAPVAQMSPTFQITPAYGTTPAFRKSPSTSSLSVKNAPITVGNSRTKTGIAAHGSLKTPSQNSYSPRESMRKDVPSIGLTEVKKREAKLKETFFEDERPPKKIKKIANLKVPLDSSIKKDKVFSPRLKGIEKSKVIGGKRDIQEIYKIVTNRIDSGTLQPSHNSPTESLMDSQTEFDLFGEMVSADSRYSSSMYEKQTKVSLLKQPVSARQSILVAEKRTAAQDLLMPVKYKPRDLTKEIEEAYRLNEIENAKFFGESLPPQIASQVDDKMGDSIRVNHPLDYPQQPPLPPPNETVKEQVTQDSYSTVMNHPETHPIFIHPRKPQPFLFPKRTPTSNRHRTPSISPRQTEPPRYTSIFATAGVVSPLPRADSLEGWCAKLPSIISRELNLKVWSKLATEDQADKVEKLKSLFAKILGDFETGLQEIFPKASTSNLVDYSSKSE